MPPLKFMTFPLLFLLIYLSFHVLLTIVDERHHAKLSTSKQTPIFSHEKISSDTLYPGGSHDKIFWFLQVTDLHLSKFFDSGRTQSLVHFCTHTVPLIRPDFVIASGDLTDAKAIDQQESVQQEEEWRAYKKAIEDSNVLSHTPWFDIRGNHDGFNVPHIEHKVNYFRKYGVQGKTHRSYRYHHRKPFGVYSFIFMDASPYPGPKRPYNFYGFLDQNSSDTLQEYSRESSLSNMTVWVGHYTTSTVISVYDNLKELIGSKAIAYLCGHLHTLGGNVPRMYTLQPQGFLELELGDWRDSRYYRVLAFDHDLLSFVDVHLDQWPIALITNPKNAQFIVPSKEMIHRVANSTHIRILAWSIAPIAQVTVFIDNLLVGDAKRVDNNSPLYVLPWNTQLYKDGKAHLISVSVKDDLGNNRNVSHYFTLDGSPLWEFEYTPSYFLLRDQSRSMRGVYLTLWFCLVAFIVFFRALKYRLHWLKSYLDHSFTLAAYRFSQNNRLLIPLLGYLLYTFVGPLIVGRLLDNHWGCVYLNGVQLYDTFIPESLPYLTEIFQLVTFVGPFYLYLLLCIHRSNNGHTDSSCLKFCWRRFGYVLLVLWQIMFTVISVTLPYGIVATLLSPCRFYLIPLSFYMLYYVDSCPRLVTPSHSLSDTSASLSN